MKNLVKFIFSFFTTWSLSLYIIYMLTVHNINYKIPLWITNFIISLIITIGIYGTFIIHYKKETIIKKYPLTKKEIILTDLLIHIIPLIHILCYKNVYINNSDHNDKSITKSLILMYTMTLIYVYNFNISKIYFGMNKFALIIPSIIIFWITLFNLNK